MTDKDMDTGTNANDESKPINNVEKSDPEVAVKQPNKDGCFVTRLQAIIALVIAIVVVILVAIIAGVISWSQSRCTDYDDLNGVFNSSKYITPRPTVDPDLPWSGIRLPKSVVPSEYTLELKVDLSTFVFTGNVDIKVRVDENTRYIIVHLHELEVRQSAVAVTEWYSGRNMRIRKQIPVPINQFYVLEMDSDIQRGSTYRIRFGHFEGKLEDDLRGFYRSTYKTRDGRTKYLAASQLQSVDARMVFPCFDEPALKAVFNVSIVHREDYTALSNMPSRERRRVQNGWVRDRFEPTPVMSTYLLAFVVADFRSREKIDNRLQIRIWAQPDMYEQTEYALEFAAKAYRFFGNYFGTPEVVPKADHVAVPDFSAGAMENWGLVLYREIALLHDEDMSSISNKYWVSLILAHEIAHTWFGNMVTMEWWDDLWLNEGFANTLMYFALDSIYRDWSVFDLQVVSNVFPVMTKDSLMTSHSISAPIRHPDDITQYFDSISYDKGMAVLRLLRGFLGWDDFRRGLQEYVRIYKYKNAEMKDLWKTFEKVVNHRYNVSKIMDTWTRQMGFPVVTISKTGNGRYRLNQSRFLLNPEDKYDENSSPYKYRWQIPFIYKVQGESRPRTQWMDMGSAEITIPRNAEWLIGNVDYVGFYRTNYDKYMWDKLTEQLKRNHTVFSPANRAGLISDAFNLARANKLSYDVALNLSLYLHKEQDFVPWKAFLDSMDFIRGMLATSSSYGLLKNYIYDLVAPIQRKIGTSDQGDLLDRNLRRALLEVAAIVGVPDAVNFATNQFESWMEYDSKISPDYGVVVYSVGIQQGGEKEWDYLWNKAQNTRVASETEVMMSALAHSQEPWLLWRYARWSLDSTKIRMQDVRNLFGYFAVSPLGRSVALQFMLTDWKEINRRFGMDPYLLRDIIYATTSLINTDFEYEQLERLYREHPPAGFASKAAENSLALVRSNINWMKMNQDIIHKWLKENVNTETGADNFQQ